MHHSNKRDKISVISTFPYNNLAFFLFQQSERWRKLRNIVQWTPFFQTYKKQRYPWIQLAGHQGNFKAGPDQGTILKKLCPQEEKCFQVGYNFIRIQYTYLILPRQFTGYYHTLLMLRRHVSSGLKIIFS